MSFTDHKITAFAHKIADLPDEPQLPAADLKSRFDACPEELRQSLNAVCDDAARLEARVEGIVVDTFGDTITEDMLSDELDATLARRSDLYYGTYTGDETFPRTFMLGFAPKLMYIQNASGKTGSSGHAYRYLALPDTINTGYEYCVLTETGFQLRDPDEKNGLNNDGTLYVYLAIK